MDKEIVVYIIAFVLASCALWFWRRSEGSKSTRAERLYAFIGLLIVGAGFLGRAFQAFEPADRIALVGIGLGLFAAIDVLTITRRESNATAARIEAQLSEILSRLPKP